MPDIAEKEYDAQNLFSLLFEVLEKYDSGLINSDQALNMGLKIIERIKGLSCSDIQDMMNDWRTIIKSKKLL